VPSGFAYSQIPWLSAVKRILRSHDVQSDGFSSRGTFFVIVETSAIALFDENDGRSAVSDEFLIVYIDKVVDVES
jgi:hypothetical protein